MATTTTQPPEADTFSILVATDCHLGYVVHCALCLRLLSRGNLPNFLAALVSPQNCFSDARHSDTLQHPLILLLLGFLRRTCGTDVWRA
jgi:hypothetical protein